MDRYRSKGPLASAVPLPFAVSKQLETADGVDQS